MQKQDIEQYKKDFLTGTLPIEKLTVLRTKPSWNVWEMTEFKKHILNLFRLGDISDDVSIPIIEKYISYFVTSFTHSSIDTQNNYETFEFLGDLTYNKSVGYYIIRRYPQLLNPEAIDILSRLKMHIISSKSMNRIAIDHGFVKFIRYSQTKHGVHMKNVNINKISEDVLESFFGAIEYVTDLTTFGLGNLVCYKIISKLLDNYNFSLKYTDLVDPYTMVKEIFDKFKALVTQVASTTTLPDGQIQVRIWQNFQDNTKNRIIGEALGTEADETKVMAAKKALETLKKENIVHPDVDKYDKYI